MTDAVDVVLISGRALEPDANRPVWASELLTIEASTSQQRSDDVLAGLALVAEQLKTFEGSELSRDILMTLSPVRGQAGIFLPPELLGRLAEAGISLYIDAIAGAEVMEKRLAGKS